MSTVRANTILDAAGGNTATVNGYTPTASNMAGRNKIINGDMRIDQRNAGASSTTNGVYTVDRWNFGTGVSGKMTYGQNYNSLTPPSGFAKYMGFKTTTAYTVGASEFFLFAQPIEGSNVTDLAWGTSGAKTVTLSFWVNSSLTGTFGGVVSNSAQNRSYPFTYTINSANTWEQKSVTITGDTTGTWLTTNGVGVHLYFELGVGSTYKGTAGSWAGATYLGATGATSVVGTLNATWNITGVQLEEGSTATPFEHRHYGTELALCQRYYKLIGKGTYCFIAPGVQRSTTSAAFGVTCNPNMRSLPTLSYADLIVSDRTAFDEPVTGFSNVAGDGTGFEFWASTTNAQGAQYRPVLLSTNGYLLTGYFAMSAEL